MGILRGSSKIDIAFNDGTLNVSGIASRNDVALLEAAVKTSLNFVNVELYEIKAEGNEVISGTGGFGIRALVVP